MREGFVLLNKVISFEASLWSFPSNSTVASSICISSDLGTWQVLGVSKAGSSYASYEQTLLEDISLITPKFLGCEEQHGVYDH
jgi:hypothetical protein